MSPATVRSRGLLDVMRHLARMVLACCLPLLAASCEQAPKVAEVGKAAPDFSLVDRQGRTWTLSKLRGQVVFVNFWATWCPPCRDEMPSMERLYRLVPKESFAMLAVLENDEPARADAFAARAGLTMPILVDREKKIWPTYGLTGVPETFIVDKKGVIREKFIGPVQWDSPKVLQMLGKYLNQQ